MADRGQITGGLLDGPLAFDNAVSPAAAAEKGICLKVAGHADILVVPDLEAGNMLAKQLTFLAGADAAGVVLGARVPIILTSRADAERTRMASCAVAVLIARRQAARQRRADGLSDGRSDPRPQCRFLEHQVLAVRNAQRIGALQLVSRRRGRRDRHGAAFRRDAIRPAACWRNEAGRDPIRLYQRLLEAGDRLGRKASRRRPAGRGRPPRGAWRPRPYRPERVDADPARGARRLTPLAPLHEPHNLAPIRAIAAPALICRKSPASTPPSITRMPVVATRFALPREYEAAGVRRYGFHGLSYEYIAGRLREIAPDSATGRVIVAHLGNGASLCAMLDGRSVDTTMGFTALDGLVMGTRCGTIDPGVMLYLEQQRGMTAKEVENLALQQSGLLGVSADSPATCGRCWPATIRAREAIELFVFRIAREIGALTASLGGLDGLVFTAGIGEHAPQIRAMVCARLGWLGAVLDEEANACDGSADQSTRKAALQFMSSQPAKRR